MRGLDEPGRVRRNRTMSKIDTEDIEPTQYAPYRLPSLKGTPITVRLLPAREFEDTSHDQVAVFHGSEAVEGPDYLSEQSLIKLSEWALGYAEGFSKAMEEA